MWNNPNNFNMPMQNMPNQFLNLNQNNLQELIKPYKEKIKKLEQELEEKNEEITQLKLQLLQYNNSNNQQFMNNNMGQMSNNMNQMNMFNNNMNQMNNNMMFNPMFQMCNQMNINDNKMMMPFIPRGNSFQKEVKYLFIEVKMENNQNIKIQCKSDEKMETLIDKFSCKMGFGFKKEEYVFLINGNIKVNNDLTI